jgi:hypothetical protein
MATVRLSKVALRSVSGRLTADLIDRVLDEILFEAYVIARAGPYATGRLAQSLKKTGPRRIGFRVEGSVGTDLPYANAVHDGAKVHAIFPKGAVGIYRFGSRQRPQLKFFWKRVGKTVFFPHIPGAPSRLGRSHPGIAKGKHFLTDPLREVARRYNLRVTYTP